MPVHPLALVTFGQVWQGMASFKREILKDRVHDLLQSHESAAIDFAELPPRNAAAYRGRKLFLAIPALEDWTGR